MEILLTKCCGAEVRIDRNTFDPIPTEYCTRCKKTDPEIEPVEMCEGCKRPSNYCECP